MKEKTPDLGVFFVVSLRLSSNLMLTNGCFFNFVKSNFHNLLIIVLCAFFYAFGQVQFLFKAAVISDGVESISMSLSYLFPILKPFLTVLYLILNIPLILSY